MTSRSQPSELFDLVVDCVKNKLDNERRTPGPDTHRRTFRNSMLRLKDERPSTLPGGDHLSKLFAQGRSGLGPMGMTAGSGYLSGTALA